MRMLVGRDSLGRLEGGSAVTIGTFDGVHLGHRALIARAISEAADEGITSAAITWDRHPNITLRPDRVPPLLTSPERKIELLESTGIDLLVVLPFDKELSSWPPERFATDVLATGLNARSVFVGAGWRFGHKAAGDVQLLEKLGAELGFDASGIELSKYAGEPVSSSRVRRAVLEGDVTEAEALLGRPFDVDGVVVRGAGRGVGLGWPTANLEIDDGLARPLRGIYAGRARAGGSWHPAAISVGVNPTFGGDEAAPPVVEAFLLDFDGDLYGETLRVEFWKRLRDEQKFDSVDDLVAQIALDVEATRSLTC
jgi:riboflavin kinase / FMN adenylyltransferase